MTRNPFAAWVDTGIDAWSLGLEASTVIGLRMARLATGGAAASDEARLMVAEKVQSSVDLTARLMTGTLGATPVASANAVVRHYRRKVAANRRRLSR